MQIRHCNERKSGNLGGLVSKRGNLGRPNVASADWMLVSVSVIGPS